jgi:hypothetical protein
MQVLHEILPLFLEIKSSVVCEEYFKKFSSVLLLDENLIRKEWNKISPRSPTGAKKVSTKKVSLIHQAGTSIIQVLWYEPDLLNYVNALVPIENFIKIHIEIIKYIEKCYAEGRQPDALNSARELSSEANLEISRILSNNEPPENQMAAFQDSIKVMQRTALEKSYKQIEREISELNKVGDIKSADAKFKILIEIQKEITKL